MAFLDIKNLRKTYGATVALNGIDLSVEAGEFVTLLGPSGSGKTTLLMSIAGFIKPDEGGIVVDGKDVTFTDPEDRDFGVVFQGYALFPHLTVAENIAFPLRVRKWDKASLSAKVAEMLALVGLEAFADRKPRQLSGGQQQRVAIARALAFGPRILLLDEPLSAPDRSLRESMQQELKRLHRKTGVTFIFVTHDQEEAYAMSDRIAVFQQGNIMQTGAPRDIYSRPASRFVAGFLGGNNLFEARYLAASSELSLFGTRQPLPPRFHAASPRPSDVLQCWVRPEDIAIGSGAVAGGLDFPARVADVFFLGASEKVTLVTTDGQALTAQLPAAAAQGLRPGDKVTCSIAPEAIGFLGAD